MGKVLPFPGRGFLGFLCLTWALHSAGWLPPCHPSSETFRFCCGGWSWPRAFPSLPPKAVVRKWWRGHFVPDLLSLVILTMGRRIPKCPAWLEAHCQLSRLAKSFIFVEKQCLATGTKARNKLVVEPNWNLWCDFLAKLLDISLWISFAVNDVFTKLGVTAIRILHF